MRKGTSWIAHLSDGRSINEKDLFTPGDVLPFRKLVRYCKKENVVINAITLIVNGVRFNSPSLSPKATFVSPIKPQLFWVAYRDVFLPFQQRAVSYVGMSWAIGDCRTHLWVNTENSISNFEIRSRHGNLETLIEKEYGIETAS